MKTKTRDNNNFRNGGVSLIAVIFGTLVMSLICLSFINAMRSGLSQNVAYTTSQAAYDAATTGVMDTQLAISECRRNPGTPGSARANACRRILGGEGDCQSFIADIETAIWGSARGGVIDAESNQRYTCITIEPTTKSYQGVIAAGTEDDSVVIPISTSGDEKYVLLSYGVGATAQSPSPSTANSNGPNFGFDLDLMNRANNERSSRNFMDGATSDNFPTIGLELSQIASSFNINDLTDNNNKTTNTGYLMLAPSSNLYVNTRTTIKNAGETVDGREILVGLAGSADKANQSPATVRCRNSAPYPTVGGVANTFNCSVLIELPNPRGGADGSRDKEHSFIRLSMPFVESNIQFEVSFYKDTDLSKPLTLNETQYNISVQGQTGDRIRRVHSNIGGMTSSAIVPMWSAAVGGTTGVAKCNDGVTCSGSSNNATTNRLQYTTTYTTTDLNLICEFTWASKNVLGGAPANIPTTAQMDNHCKDR